MPRPILLGSVGDSAAENTTLTRGLVRILGESQAPTSLPTTTTAPTAASVPNVD